MCWVVAGWSVLADSLIHSLSRWAAGVVMADEQRQVPLRAMQAAAATALR